MKTNEYYQKVVIESEKDLPGKYGLYFTCRKGDHKTDSCIFNPESSYYKQIWLQELKWYLLPVFQILKDKGLINESYVNMDKVNEICDKAELNKPKVKTAEKIRIWQICPKCQGQGKIWFPPDIPYNPTYTTNGEPFICDVCKGEKIIDSITGLPRSQFQEQPLTVTDKMIEKEQTKL